MCHGLLNIITLKRCEIREERNYLQADCLEGFRNCFFTTQSNESCEVCTLLLRYREIPGAENMMKSEEKSLVEQNELAHDLLFEAQVFKAISRMVLRQVRPIPLGPLDFEENWDGG